MAPHPDHALDRLCSWTALHRSPSRIARPLEERGRTHDELHLGPVGRRPHHRLGAHDQPDPEGAPSPTL